MLFFLSPKKKQSISKVTHFINTVSRFDTFYPLLIYYIPRMMIFVRPPKNRDRTVFLRRKTATEKVQFFRKKIEKMIFRTQKTRFLREKRALRAFSIL